jgi:hypothetical protein
MSSEELHKLVKDPAKLAEVNAFLLTPEGRGVISEVMAGEIPEPGDQVEEVVVEPNAAVEEFNQAEADQQAADAQVAADKTAADKALADAETARVAEENLALLAAGITVYRDAAGKIVKLVQEYQADDGHGNPVGRPTHLEARNWIELAGKQKEAHTQATRAFHRLKDQKTTFRKPVDPIKIPDVPLMSEQERIQAAQDLNSDDETVVLKADRKLRADQIMRDQRNEAIQSEERRQREVSDEFKSRHLNDFNPCQANAKLIGDYIKENNLVWTLDNLELALAATEPQLVPVQGPVAEETVSVADNPPEVPQAVQPAAQAPVITPAPVAAAVEPVVPAAAPNPPVPARRPGVNAGLVPGQPSGQRPVTQPAGLTMKEIMKWTGDQMKKERANPARRAEIDRVIAAYNKARTSRV